jgi:parvulin-like peptidyl-prolyl isomerase
MAASHVLIAYAGAVGALPNITRTREEAKARAGEVRTKLLAGDKFASIARAYSDDSSASKGGAMGGFNPGVFVPEFEDAVKGLAVGGISAVVETPFGFHVIRRDAVTEVHGAHLLVSWKGAEQAPDTVKRSKEEAKVRAEEALKAIKEGKDWNTIVREYSEGPAADVGGDLGWFTKGQIFEPLDSTAFNLDIGATSEVMESPRGFHILKRLE